MGTTCICMYTYINVHVIAQLLDQGLVGFCESSHNLLLKLSVLMLFRPSEAADNIITENVSLNIVIDVSMQIESHTIIAM